MNKQASGAGSPEANKTVGFEEMHLQAGEQLRLTPQEPATPAEHHTVQYIGALPGKGLITTLPVAGEKGLWMPPGSGYVIRVLSRTHVYAFSTQVIRARATPYPHVHFQYPASIQARRVRQSLRIGVNMTVGVVDAGGRSMQATLLDLSMHGARLSMDASPEGEQLTLTLPLHLDEAEDRLSLQGKIRNLKGPDTSGQGPVVGLGVEFNDLERSQALLLHYFIDHAIAEAGAQLI